MRVRMERVSGKGVGKIRDERWTREMSMHGWRMAFCCALLLLRIDALDGGAKRRFQACIVFHTLSFFRACFGRAQYSDAFLAR